MTASRFRQLLDSGRPLLMGVLNVTPDSFSDHGEHFDPQLAIEHGLAMAEAGADIIDVGGESTRPGAVRVEAGEQIARTQGVIEALRRGLPERCLISIDTTRVAVARAAVAAGAELLNDVAASRESGMLAYAAEAGLPIVLMHMQGQPATMQQAPAYADVVAQVKAFLLDRAAMAERAGLPRRHIVIDPGIGFGKSRQHNLSLVANIGELVASGYPVMLGTSRKRFMGAITRETDFRQLVGATCATSAYGLMAGVRLFRVHDVQANRQALEVTAALLAARGATPGPR